MRDDINRRTVLTGIGAGTATLTFAGAVAADGEARYLVRLGDRSAERRVRRRGFTVENRLADGHVLVVTGADDASDDLEAIEDVSDAVPDFMFELEGPELMETADVDPGDDTKGNGNGNGEKNGHDTDDTDETSEIGRAHV